MQINLKYHLQSEERIRVSIGEGNEKKRLLQIL